MLKIIIIQDFIHANTGTMSSEMAEFSLFQSEDADAYYNGCKIEDENNNGYSSTSIRIIEKIN